MHRYFDFRVIDQAFAYEASKRQGPGRSDHRLICLPKDTAATWSYLRALAVLAGVLAGVR